MFKITTSYVTSVLWKCSAEVVSLSWKQGQPGEEVRLRPGVPKGESGSWGLSLSGKQVKALKQGGQQRTSAGRLRKAVSLHVFGSQALGEPWGPGTELGLLPKRNRKCVKSFKDRDMTCSAAWKRERVPAAAWVVERVRGRARRCWGYLVV